MGPSTVPQAVELIAPPAWRAVDFISDLHLHAGEPATFTAWRHYLDSTPADAVFMLGDVFEAWVGDDVVNEPLRLKGTHSGAGFEDRCARVMGDAAARLALFLMHGNRDFLVGERLMDLCNTTLLADPTVLVFGGRRWLLSHGDALFLGDVDYQQFRLQVRSPNWQQAFLAKPLAERQEIARQLRAQSEAHKKSGTDYADVDANAARQWLQAADARTLIHGHTHKPAIHDLGQGYARVVLSDWDMAATPPRGEVLRLTADALQCIPLA